MENCLLHRQATSIIDSKRSIRVELILVVVNGSGPLQTAIAVWTRPVDGFVSAGSAGADGASKLLGGLAGPSPTIVGHILPDAIATCDREFATLISISGRIVGCLGRAPWLSDGSLPPTSSP